MTNLNVLLVVHVAVLVVQDVWVVVLVWDLAELEGGGGAGISGACSPASAILYLL